MFLECFCTSLKLQLFVSVYRRLYETTFTVKQCDNSTATASLYGSYSAASEFYVFVGVTAFLYCIGILLFYVFGDDKYRNIENIPIVVSMMLALLLLVLLLSGFRLRLLVFLSFQDLSHVP